MIPERALSDESEVATSPTAEGGCTGSATSAAGAVGLWDSLLTTSASSALAEVAFLVGAGPSTAELLFGLLDVESVMLGGGTLAGVLVG